MAKRILVIEDNPLNLELVTDVLELSGYEVISSETAEEGIRTAEQQHPDAILMDVALPDMDGLEATRTLKSGDATKQIPIIVLTAHAMSGDAARAREAGCDGYITKPIDAKRFAAQVEAVLERQSRREDGGI